MINAAGGVSSVDEIEHAKVVQPPAHITQTAHIQSMEQYKELYRKSIEEPEAFWSQAALDSVSWFHPFDQSFSGSFEKGDVRWFANGKLNISYNCLDRHVAANPEKIAIIWEGDEIGEEATITYAQLFADVCKLANALKRIGVKKGDSVAIYMPMVPEAAVAMLACTRIGAMHSVVFAGFSSQALRDRIIDGNTRFVITTNQGVRGGRAIALKKTVDDAIQGLNVEKVIVSKRKDVPTPMQEGRDIWFHEALANERPYCPAEWMDSEDPLFVLYTSGSTGKPKGLIHTHGGYLVYASLTHKYVFDYHPNDVYACVADVGWITGHSYIIYGPLCNGATTVMFEGLPTYPTASRYWQMVEKFKITSFYTAPTAIRALMKFGNDPVANYDLSSLRVLGSVGEPINPEAWRWYNDVVGKGKASIVDTYWQTETGGHMLTPLPGATPTKPGSATFPFFGIKPIVLDPQTGQPATPNEHGLTSGVLCIEKPWPSIARTVSGDHERYVKTYFSDYKGFYFTGDGVTVDADGYYWITGRVDDVINKAGHRLGTAEIESALVSNAACAEAAVIAIADDLKGQAIVAFCALRHGFEDNEQTENALKLEVRKQIGPIATPDHIVIVSQLPKTRSGKIMRRLLRKIAQNETKDLGDTSTLADESVVRELIEKVAKWVAHS